MTEKNNHLKNVLRLKYKKILKKIPFERKNEAHIALFKYISSISKKYTNILSFSSLDFEINTKEINQYIIENKNLFLPKIYGDILKIHPVKNLQNDLEKNNKFKILEPKKKLSIPADLQKIDLIILPGLVFNRNNHRIGFGKGYYDKLLVHMPKAMKIGIGYKEQLSKNIFTNEIHDIELNNIKLF